MINKDSTLAEYYAIEPIKFSIVTDLCLHQSFASNLSTPELNLKLVLSSEDENDKRVLILNFYDIKSLVFSQPSLSLFQIPFLEITSLDRQWEKIKYKASDKEESISFYFNSFEVSLS
jgi:hypothetical protein